MEFNESPLPGRPSERKASGRRRRNRVGVWIVGTVVVAAALVGAFVGAALWTDRPQFCGTCHEMRPYVEAWAAGPHNDVWCVDCHVGKGYPARFAHKFAALQEVVGHFSGRTTFPLVATPHVGECETCHSTVVPKIKAAGFDHAVHEREAACQACHADAGHAVTTAGLSAANALNPGVVRVAFSAGAATVGRGKANVSGHVPVACTHCHDMKKTGCPACHTLSASHYKPPTGALPACSLCHKAGVSWTFTHPTTADCQTCHEPSAKHFMPPSGKLTGCSQCHKQPGKSWAFTHPAQSADCTDCHELPAKHFKPASASLKPCTQCHEQAGIAWKFSHPGSGADCQGCHTPPTGHSAGQCSNCHHKTGVSFAFAHPATGAPHGIGGRSCKSCHPNGYTTSSCTCHG